MSLRKIIVIVVICLVGIISATLLIQSNESPKNPSNKKEDNKNSSTEETKIDINEVISKMNDALSMSSVTNGGTFKEGFRKGINMGNMLEAPNEGDWGVTFDEEYFKLIKEQGFDFVRIPIRWSNHCNKKLSELYVDNALSGNTTVTMADFIDDNFLDAEFLARVDYIIDCAIQNGLGVVINVHHFEELFEMNFAASDKNVMYLTTTLEQIWANLAIHYKNHPDNVVFEILNEPHGTLTSETWAHMQIDLINIIRDFDVKRKIIIQSGNWGSYTDINKLWIPNDDKNLILSFHYYDPFNFTHQGADWTGSDMNQYLGTRWTGDDLERQKIDAVFKNVKSWSEATGIPVFLGEFGSYEKADYNSRIAWTRTVRETAEKYGFAWCYWEFCSSFGIYDSQTKEFKKELVNALVGGDVKDFNTGKGGVKVNYSIATINPDQKYKIGFTYDRKMEIICEGWTNMFLYDTNSNTQIDNIKGAEDWGFVSLPLKNNYYVNETSGFFKNTIEPTVKNPKESITDIRVTLCDGTNEVVLFDTHSGNPELLKTGYDDKVTMTLKLKEFHETFKDTKQGDLFLKVFIETVPDRRSTYDRTGTLEFVEMLSY